jgi:hypothetical protein
MLIDYVVPFVDMSDPEWKKLYKKYIHKDPNGSARFRDYGSLRYQFRGIEKNMPWIRNVYLVVQSPSQVPNWLNTKHPKVKIIYHKDIIPKEFLPTFNSSVIEMWYNRIPGISEYFIVSNDDMIPIRTMQKDQFFRKDTPVYASKLQDTNTKLTSNGIWDHILFNSKKLSSILNKKRNVISYSNAHLLLPHKLSIWNEVWKKGKTNLLRGMENSRTRRKYNHNHWLFAFYAIIDNKAILDMSIPHKGYVYLESEKSIEDLKAMIETASMICINDGGYKDPDVERKIADTLNAVLPNKSSFEK